jgi:hypothetical protein
VRLADQPAELRRVGLDRRRRGRRVGGRRRLGRRGSRHQRGIALKLEGVAQRGPLAAQA